MTALEIILFILRHFSSMRSSFDPSSKVQVSTVKQKKAPDTVRVNDSNKESVTLWTAEMHPHMLQSGI